MEFEQLMKLIETVSASSLTSFQYEEKGVKLKLGKEVKGAALAVSGAGSADLVQSVQSVQSTAISAVQETKSAAEAQEPVSEAKAEGKLILSPLVGTFYIAPAEDADPFVAVGDTVKKGQTLAIVEAMKLMNEIESDYDGVIEEVLAENGKPVEYNQPLFRLR